MIPRLPSRAIEEDTPAGSGMFGVSRIGIDLGVVVKSVIAFRQTVGAALLQTYCPAGAGGGGGSQLQTFGSAGAGL